MDCKTKKNLLFAAILVVAAVAIYFICKMCPIKENFTHSVATPQPHSALRTKVMKICENSKTGRHHDCNELDFFSTRNYQGKLPSRISPGQLASSVSFNLPHYDNQAVPSDPLAMRDLVGSNHKCSCGSREGFCMCQSAQLAVPKPNVPFKTQYMEDLPVGEIDSCDALGNQQKFMVYDRLMFSTSKHRNYGNGDYIRGDLPISPDSNQSGWFRSHLASNPESVLNQGAMNVMGASDTAVNQTMYSQLTGHINGTFAGSPITNLYTHVSGGDLMVSAF